MGIQSLEGESHINGETYQGSSVPGEPGREYCFTLSTANLLGAGKSLWIEDLCPLFHG